MTIPTKYRPAQPEAGIASFPCAASATETINPSYASIQKLGRADQYVSRDYVSRAEERRSEGGKTQHDNPYRCWAWPGLPARSAEILSRSAPALRMTQTAAAFADVRRMMISGDETERLLPALGQRERTTLGALAACGRIGSAELIAANRLGMRNTPWPNTAYSRARATGQEARPSCSRKSAWCKLCPSTPRRGLR